jgi:hypothetical protein
MGSNTIYINPAKHGSLENAIADQTRSLQPTVGIGVTEIMFSDRHPYTVIEVISPKRIRVQADTATRVDDNGYSESQEYNYTPNPKGEIITLFLNKWGKWKQAGQAQSSTFLIGKREEYYDFTL